MNDSPNQADARTLLAADAYAQSLGITYVGTADDWHLELEVTAAHCNFLGGLHGAVLFGLADTAMGLTSNADQSVAVAIDASVSYLRGAKPGDVLRTVVTPIRGSRSLGWYQIDIVNQDGEPVGAFRGTVYRPRPH